MRKIRVFYQKVFRTYIILYFVHFSISIFLFFFPSFVCYTHFYLNHSLEIHIYIESLPLETFIGSRVKSPFSYTIEIWFRSFSFANFWSISISSKCIFKQIVHRNVRCLTKPFLMFILDILSCAPSLHFNPHPIISFTVNAAKHQQINVQKIVRKVSIFEPLCQAISYITEHTNCMWSINIEKEI